MSRSLARLKTNPDAALRIVCLPYAGGNAGFVRAWSERLPDCVELVGVHYPDRQRIAKSHATRSAAAIATVLLEELVPYLDRPLILFGYSLGALVAYELSMQLTQHTACMPTELIVAAARAPHLSSTRAPMSGLPDDEFIARLRSLGGTPESVLRHTELLQYFLPTLRCDFATAESYRPSTVTRLTCPITAVSGQLDGMVPESAVAAWKTHTCGAFHMHRLPGGHFFLNDCTDALLALIRQVVFRHVSAELI